VFAPNGAGKIGIFTPSATSGTFSFGPTVTGTYWGGVLLPDGRVLFIPNTGTSICIYTPNDTTGTFVMVTIASAGYIGGVLLPDGRVLFIPNIATTMGLYLTNTPAPKDFCLHPFFNKL
jgi:hypothetical protein